MWIAISSKDDKKDEKDKEDEDESNDAKEETGDENGKTADGDKTEEGIILIIIV